MTKEMTQHPIQETHLLMQPAMRTIPNSAQIKTFLEQSKAHPELKPALDLLDGIGPMSPAKLAKFLKSPHGKSELQELINILAIEFHALQNAYAEKAMVSHMRRQRILAFLLLILLHSRHKAHARADLNAMIDEQIYKMLHPKPNKTNEQAHESMIFGHEYAAMLTSYGLVRSILETVREEKVAASEAVFVELSIVQGLKQRYQICAEHLDQVNHFYDSLAALKEIASKSSRLASLQQKHDETSQRIDEIQELITTYLSDNRDEEAGKLLNYLNGLHLMNVGLEEMMAVENSEKQFLNEDGELVNSSEKAHFILSPEKKLVKEDGVFYLVNKAQDLAQMSQEDKHQAKDHYVKAKPDICCLKQVIHEQNDVNNRSERLLLSRSDSLQKDIQTLDQQMKLVEAAEASTKALMIRPDMNPAMTPTPRPVGSGKAQSKSLPMTPKYLLALVAQNPSPENVEHLIKTVQLTSGRLDPQQIRDFAKKIQPGMAIQETTMRDMLTNIERLSVPAYKPNVTAAPSPLKMQMKPW